MNCDISSLHFCRWSGFSAFFFAAIVSLAQAFAAAPASAEEQRPSEETVRDRLWIFTCVAGSDDSYLKGANWPRMSRMTPVETAFYLNVPNMIMVRWQGQPEPPFDQYAIPFRPLKQVVWSLVGSGGKTDLEARKAALEFASRTPNVTGFFLDDFFRDDGSASLTLEELRNLRKELVIDGKKRDLYVVVYDHQLDLPIKPHLELCDKITFWTWSAKHLENLEENFVRLEKLIPERPKLLGCYFWDFPGKRPVPLELMQKQCRLGLKWLQEGRIEGIIFLGNTVADLDLPSVEWTRKWIAEVGDQPIVVKKDPQSAPSKERAAN